jgi:hypothetical protein
MGGPLFMLTGVIAGAVYAITKVAKKAMWTWTILLLIAFSFLGVGGVQMQRMKNYESRSIS